ncbi:small nuclear ribonucleoprotein SmD1 [Trypanosoma equiperdum]|uniref:Small nuclear ribonucleoprotein SmD1 n=5 Tax=Trypanozoon TaxID=39700 RepID=D6XKM9_TRYB2|nr:SmD-1 like small nuclear ribonucleoprotein,putative [Trypanosoma brucei gambiense DAL972]XP_845935.1 small nuclear ribonucleoprotein SmD1 [Trypanosoma brucei brucei TREU927]AAG00461.1 Sm-D1 [Trypanosoma brucei]RHW71243.1 small nuclear ribonucleoprotein SmD1 [Trypanosoma brucei equiperdum]SCU65164.1 small nuclear ribonucleoprotein SmD1 [Trypanosoma equiperdum]AAX69421.1 small nuclear ribonucleoprotein SmD1 [Trypanosoma brucei]AAZ12376.1 small nuclear ribonucleoprotein SmD1 [Trypanosoma bruc|eukprot:XP_011774682.1 SmD-1 like small nuclear ribonucleoprotein,putative [Trypanosoma brucei gambiense DAL972]
MPAAESSTLIGFLQQLRGTQVEIEMMNSTIVTGEITFVEANMNTYMRHVKITAKGKNPEMAETYMVCGSKIRYVILPEAMNTDDVLVKAAAAKARPGSKRTERSNE